MNHHNKIKALLLLVIFFLCAGIFSSVYANFNPKNISVGVLAFRGPDVAKKRWGPTIQYLNQQLPEYHFNLVPKNIKTLNELVKDKDIDFILTNTGHYVLLERLYGVSRLATLRNLRQGKALDNFGSVIFTRSDRSDINKLKDFSGKSFMGVNKNGFGGFQVAWREFKRAGIDPFSDFSSLSFSGFPQDNIAYAVLEGKVDGGTMRTDSLERLARKGKIKLEDIKIINAKKVKGFPFLLSSELYPEWPFSKAQHVPLKVAKKVIIALLQIQQTSSVARQGHYSEWTVPSDYQPVHELMKELKIGSYAEKNSFNFSSIIKMYWIELTCFIITVIIIAYLLLLISRCNGIIKVQKNITKSKFKFLANAIKETQTLLETLISNGNKIDKNLTSSDQSGSLHRMLESSENIAIFFNHIKDYSAIESGNITVESSRFNLHDLLININKGLADKLKEKQIELSISVENNVPNILLGDEMRLAQVILNILNITIRFSHQANITLQVKLLKQTSNQVNLEFNVENDHMVLNKNQIEMLFNSFVQTDISNIQNYGGSCLSLYNSNKLVEKMEGKTWVNNDNSNLVKFGFNGQFMKT
ncbi:phosphate/phosphite/phosphonate ABC transporter substrate-binding protein [sulfur-oxidizing endosymbiont of Gigantopelta aegis]|uniref:phosphate/phosphite/phosphonate ABC transporter substrate-binding protein n=1 Tax=sulfur-oxidizing endosymbiont of Gigantopelta aegis TaxID=2794934 RepID=UPI0018DCC1B6|nr:phosphate/phosphite/phosphonate ABC transporter substrate-binding protein [sulfur-oxidizing endosymbiont of Gigantopelta aegis]